MLQTVAERRDVVVATTGVGTESCRAMDRGFANQFGRPASRHPCDRQRLGIAAADAAPCAAAASAAVAMVAVAAHVAACCGVAVSVATVAVASSAQHVAGAIPGRLLAAVHSGRWPVDMGWRVASGMAAVYRRMDRADLAARPAPVWTVADCAPTSDMP